MLTDTFDIMQPCCAWVLVSSSCIRTACIDPETAETTGEVSEACGESLCCTSCKRFGLPLALDGLP